MADRQQIVETLRTRLRELAADCHAWGGVVSTGCPEFDRLLARDGLEQGTLVEWIGHTGSGAATLALVAARAACSDQQTLVVIDEQKDFYPPAAQALGIDLRRTVVVQPASARDRDWSLVQSLRSPGVAAVLCWPDRIHQRMLRRLQLAAEQGGTLGLLVRPPSALAEPSWAKVRLVVEGQKTSGHERRWRVTLADSQASRREAIQLELDHETSELRQSSHKTNARPLSVAAPFAAPAPVSGATPA